MQKYLSFLVLCFFVGCTSFFPGKTSIHWIDGIWTGVGYQLDINETWKIEFHADSQRDFFIIRYPDLNCHGTWTLTSSDGYSFSFTEKIEKGEHECADGGSVVITRVDENHSSFSYFRKDGMLDSFSTLERKRVTGQ